jgi:hypothetical protein
MQSRTLGLGLLLVAATCTAGQQRYFFTRKYVVGQTDRYVMNSSVTSPMAMTMSMTLSQRVKKVYPNGDADVEIKTSAMQMTMNGKSMPVSAGGAQKSEQTTVTRLNKFGTPVAGANSQSAMMGMDMGMGSGISGLEKGLPLGQTVPFHGKPGQQGAAMSGTNRLSSVKNGIARIDQTYDMSMGQMGTMHGTGAFSIRMKDGVMLSTEMNMSGTSMAGQTRMHMSMKKV